MNIAPWQHAVDQHLKGLALLRRLLDGNDIYLRKQWATDYDIMKNAVVYDWGAEPTEACLAAQASVPADADFNMWNIPMNGTSWWHFAKPLPLRTVTDKHSHVRALSFGWIGRAHKSVFPRGTVIAEVETSLLQSKVVDAALCISAWIDDDTFGVSPSQLFYWRSGDTLNSMLARVRKEHNDLYGPGGKYAGKPQIGEEEFMATAEGLGRFILAGLTWLRQRVVVETEEKLERHRRKEFQRKTGQTAEPLVKVISLRRSERKAGGTSSEAAEGHREYSHRFMVGLETGGFFRNQACGPQMGDRRLTWIMPFVKGPADKPLRLPVSKVFTVNR